MPALRPPRPRLGSARRSLACALLALAAPVHAGDGVIELNQTCATQTGCAPGDAPLFPITLSTRGSYRLTSDLAVPDENTNGIEVGSDDVTIDFAGFTLHGPGFVSLGTGQCSLPGTGHGILNSGPAAAFVAHGGRVRGMGSHGIRVFAPDASIERMIVERNCGRGIELGDDANVRDSQARANAQAGFSVAAGGNLAGLIASGNGESGIEAGADTLVNRVVARGNGGPGIYAQFGGVVSEVIAAGNGGTGIVAENVSGSRAAANGSGGILASGPVTQSSAVANLGTGISGFPGSEPTRALNASIDNTAPAEPVTNLVGCVLVETVTQIAVVHCPP